MSYQVLARKYRPQTLDGLVGQEHVARTLRNAIETGRIAHAFLFSGIRGVGKTTAARILAKALNCENGPTADPCNECSNCREITASASVDVAEIDGASNRGIDSIRELNDNVRYHPAKSRYRIYIIDEAHMVTREAFNALLKTLEEPPGHVKFVFATTAPDKFPDTILSRCQRYDFKRINAGRIAEQLREIAGQENVELSDSALYLIAREAEGSMRDAESMLDRLIAFSGGKVGEQDVAEVLGVADRRALYELAEAVLRADPQTALAVIDRLHDSGRDLERFTRDLLEHWRNLTVTSLYDGGTLLGDLPPDEIEELRRQAAIRSVEDLHRMFRVVLRGEREVRGSGIPRFVLEMMVVRLATLDAALPVDEVLERLDELERSLGGGGSPPQGSRPQPASRERGSPRQSPGGGARRASDTTTAAEAAGSSAAPPRDGAEPDWDGFLEFVQARRISLYLNLSQVDEVRREAGTLFLGVSRERYRKELSNRETLSALRELATEFFGESMRVLVEGSAGVPRPTEPSPAEQARQHPAVRTALEVFSGEIREVRPVRRRP